MPRQGRRGGGVGLFVSSALKFSLVTLPHHTSFEAICGKISTGTASLKVLNLYRALGPTATFFNECEDVVSHLATLSQDLLIMGDFNLHVDEASKQTDDFQEILASFDLLQHVIFPTHIHGHTLDLIISANHSVCKPLSVLPSDRISDHLTVLAELNIPITSHPEKKTIKYRNIKE